VKLADRNATDLDTLCFNPAVVAESVLKRLTKTTGSIFMLRFGIVRTTRGRSFCIGVLKGTHQRGIDPEKGLSKPKDLKAERSF
jgi:hypothetical protein